MLCLLILKATGEFHPNLLLFPYYIIGEMNHFHLHLLLLIAQHLNLLLIYQDLFIFCFSLILVLARILVKFLFSNQSHYSFINCCLHSILIIIFIHFLNYKIQSSHFNRIDFN